jgi:threonine/homoserine/homoserine lactone efflux protein
MLLSRDLSTQLPTIQRTGVLNALRDGAIVEALNVKTAMFFLAFIPQFVSAEQPLAPQFIVMGTLCVFLNTAVDLFAVVAADKFVSSGAAAAARARLLRRTSGLTMLGLGFYVALAKREA